MAVDGILRQRRLPAGAEGKYPPALVAQIDAEHRTFSDSIYAFGPSDSALQSFGCLTPCRLGDRCRRRMPANDGYLTRATGACRDDRQYDQNAALEGSHVISPCQERGSDTIRHYIPSIRRCHSLFRMAPIHGVTKGYLKRAAAPGGAVSQVVNRFSTKL